jgi:mannose-6-phosphate isomerase-like protein (cupin superfamily)
MSTVVLPGQHDAASRAGRGLDILLSGKDSAGAAAVIDCHVPAATAGPPLHRHPASDETFVVISGTLLVHVDGQLTELTAGGLVHVSRGTPHTFATPPGDGAHFLTLHTPGGFEGFHVAAAAAEHLAGGPLPQPELIKLAGGFDWQLAGPPLLPTGELLRAPAAPGR